MTLNTAVTNLLLNMPSVFRRNLPVLLMMKVIISSEASKYYSKIHFCNPKNILKTHVATHIKHVTCRNIII